MFKNHVLLNVNEGAPFIERLLIMGNDDGSMSVADPKHTAQIFMVLSTTWLDPDIFEVSVEEYANKVQFMEQLTEMLGVPFMDEELREQFMKLHKLYNKN